MSEPTAADEARLLDVVRLYQEALEAGRRPNRAALLADHPDLADELAGYLDALDALHDAAGSWSAPLPVAHVAQALSTTTPLGDFQILREIGRGGMGVVYEAEQLSLGRRVALKVLPLAGALDERQLARFKNEARAAAQLHHSHIVPVYAVGCERGVHFYAMQLIEGRTLAELVTEERGRRASPASPSKETAAGAVTVLSDSGVGHRHIARLMLQAAQALDHAHQMGVVHRDIKPANLLVDGRGQLWVTDFGLAQYAAGLELTRTGDVLGTLRYASPEQASGQGVLDHRTDIYSLGATFYELLALLPPFTGSNRGQLLRQIIDEEAPALRRLERSVPVELETIVLKCLSKSTADRYRGARELADDLERYLSNRPIHARRPSLLDRGRKWLLRHPGIAAVATLSLVVLTVGLIINQALLAREQARTNAALHREQLRAEQAERRLQQARQLTDFLIELGEEELPQHPMTLSLRRKMLETALSHYQTLIAERGEENSDEEFKATRARVARLLDDLAVLQGADHAMLLSGDGVLDELKLTEPDRKKVRDLASQLMRDRFRILFDRELSGAQKRQRELTQARTGEQALSKLLTPAQRRRLAEVALQLKGLWAFREPQVISALALTQEQRQRVREIEGRAFLPEPGSPHRPPPEGKPPPKGFGPAFVDFEARSREAVGRCLEVLTPEQVKKWQALTGEPYTGPHPFSGHRPFPGPPR